MEQKLKNSRKNRGITLIALVITIIVMLILVAVTITMAVNGGLFDYAGKATAETNGAITNEQELANLEANMTVDELIDKYTSSEEKTITFKIGSESYTVVEGTTWGTWANSTEGTWTVAEDGKIVQGTAKFIGYEKEAVESDVPIVEGREYISLITFKLEETTYIAEDGMNWQDWMFGSDYDSSGFNTAEGTVEFNYKTVRYDGTVVRKSDPIVPGGLYYI